MKISLKGTNLKLLDSIRTYLDKKIVKPAEKMLSKSGEAVSLDMEVAKTTKHHKKGMVFRVEANLLLGKRMLRAEAYGEDLYEAIDLLKEELDQEVKKFKSRRKTLELKGARKVKRGTY
jgi:ribosomal subunit interface protein